MKKKNSSLENKLTTRILQRELAKLKNELKEDLVADIRKRIDMAERALNVEIMASALDARQRLEAKISNELDKLYTRIDPILQEVLASREERTITANQIAELRDRVDEHEDRIKRVETP